MSEDRMKMYEAQAELVQTKEKLENVQREYDILKKEVAVNNLIKTVNNFQAQMFESLKEIQQNISDLSAKSDNAQSNINVISSNLEAMTKDFAALSVRGGTNEEIYLDSLEILQPDEKHWKQLAIKLPYAMSLHGAQFLNNNLYIFGGQQKEYSTSNTYKLSQSLKWEKMADLNEKRSGISNSSVILNERIWVLGGSNEGQRLKSVEMYNRSTDKWTYMKEMREHRTGSAATVVDGQIFCCGGYNGKRRVETLEFYDPFSNMWTLICSMPKPRGAHASVAMDGNLIVVGGWDGEEHLKNVLILDTTNKKSEWIEQKFVCLSRKYISIAKIDHNVFICGGETEKSITDAVEIFDGEVWTNGPRMTTPRRWATAVAIPMNFGNSLK